MHPVQVEEGLREIRITDNSIRGVVVVAPTSNKSQHVAFTTLAPPWPPTYPQLHPSIALPPPHPQLYSSVASPPPSTPPMLQRFSIGWNWEFLMCTVLYCRCSAAVRQPRYIDLQNLFLIHVLTIGYRAVQTAVLANNMQR